MNITVKQYEKADLPYITEIWNEVVKDGNAFPQTECLSLDEAEEFFASQTFTAAAKDENSGEVLGVYILHPNNIGHCGHICNASFAVKKSARGLKIGKKLVVHCLETAKEKGFGILQFNAVVKSNLAARTLYENLGFAEIGTVKGGFRYTDGKFEDIVLYYHTL
ncbi:MAG: GNAT family N-acetyltransferase [Acutalibacteraceae bacterium]